MKAKNPRYRGLHLGYPKSGKTGALAALVNSGRFEIGILDFDHNPDPLYAFVKPEFFSRVSIKTLADNLRDDGRKAGVSGEPTAFRDAWRALDHWVDDEGTDWGRVNDWIGGPGTFDTPSRILVCDTLTSMGDAAFRRRRFYRPSGSKGDDSDTDWGAAMRDQATLMEALASRALCHVIVNAHIKLIEPRAPRAAKGESPEVAEARAALFAKRADKIASKLCPSALGQALPPEIARFLPSVLLIDGNRNGKRKIITSGEEGLDLGVPAPHIKKELPLETGLLTVIDAVLNNQEDDEDGIEEA